MLTMICKRLGVHEPSRPGSDFLVNLLTEENIRELCGTSVSLSSRTPLRGGGMLYGLDFSGLPVFVLAQWQEVSFEDTNAFLPSVVLFHPLAGIKSPKPDELIRLNSLYYGITSIAFDDDNDIKVFSSFVIQIDNNDQFNLEKIIATSLFVIDHALVVYELYSKKEGKNIADAARSIFSQIGESAFGLMALGIINSALGIDAGGTDSSKP